MPLRSRSSLAVTLCLATLAAAGPARADWPMARHDAKRAAMAQGKSDIQKPKVAWSAYLGGAIGAQNMLPYDVGGDGKVDVIYLTGDSLTAKRLDDSVLWTTRLYGEGFLLGIADLDGDGKDEVVAYTGRRAFVIDANTGAVRWSQPDGEMGKTSYLRLADLDGDARPDLVIGECGGCGASKPQAGFVYSFGKGFASPTKVTLPGTNGITPGLTVVDVAGLGPVLIYHDMPDTLQMVDGKTGKKLASSAPFGQYLAWSVICAPGNIDGKPGDELVCVASDSTDPAPKTPDERKVFALSPKGGANPSLDLLWSWQVPAGESLSGGYTDPLIDLDASGSLEVVVSGKHTGGTFTTHVLDAATGAPLASTNGRYLGAAHLESLKSFTVLTNVGTGVSAWAFNAGAAALIGRWTLPDRYPLTEPAWDRLRVSQASITRPLAVDLDGDGLVDLLTAKSTPGTPEIQGYVSEPAAVLEYASLGFADDVGPIALWSVPPLDQGYPQLAIAESDGGLRLLDKKLQPSKTLIHFGGFYASGGWFELGLSPVASGKQILARDSRGRVVSLDASQADASTPPKTTWTFEASYSPVFAPGLAKNGSGVAVIYHDSVASPPTFHLLAMDGVTGKVIWNAKLDGNPTNDAIVGRFDDDDIPDLAVQLNTADGKLTTFGFAGASGKQLFAIAAAGGGCGAQSSGIALADWNGDGRDDVLQATGVVRADSGLGGAPLAASTLQTCYFLPTPVDIDGDGKEEVVLHGGLSAVTVLDHSLQTTVFQSKDDDRPYPYGALALCDKEPVLAEGSWQFPARLKRTHLGSGKTQSTVLADGVQYPSEDAALAAGAGLGQLTSASVHADLAGDGAPVVLVGSTDGWLYAVDACTGTLRFAKDFGFAVGEAIFGDTDGDGLDEILVSVADGKLYALRDDPVTPGTSGSGGMGGMEPGTGGSDVGAGGMGGTPRARGAAIPLYGRAGCYCSAPAGGAEGSAAGALLLLGCVLAARRRRARVG